MRFLRVRPVVAGLVVLAIAYLILEILLLGRRAFGTDEFRHLERIAAITQAVPYAEVPIVKTLVGLYAQTPLFLLVGGSYAVVCALKVQLAVAVAITAVWIGWRIDRWLGPIAALAGTGLFLMMPEVIERSAEVRVDMLSALAGSISLLLLCERRWRGAGIWLGLALLCTQKAAYYALGTGAALAVMVALAEPGQRRRSAGAAVQVVCWSAALVLGYVVVFVAIAGPEPVWENLVVRALQWGQMSGEREELYRNLDRFWWASLRGHWGLYALAAAGELACLVRAHRSKPHLVLGAFAAMFMFLCLRHSEPWHYFMVFPAPVLAILASVAVSEFVAGIRGRRWLGGAFAAALGTYLVLVPGRAIPRNLDYDASYQRYNIELADALLGPGDTYLDGVAMIPKRTHVPIDELIWLDKMFLRRLRTLDRRRALEIAAALEADPPLLVIQNYRTRGFPKWLRSLIRRDYVHLSGAISIYAPRLEPGTSRLEKSGRYRLKATRPVVINGTWLAPDAVVELTAGPIDVGGKEPIRLITETGVALDRRFHARARIFRHYPSSKAPGSAR